ncbi:MAG: DNA topoisomerase I [Candidatus Taylorbacteria bacterium RIFCSPLOWO2_01_FULL_45_15b]|uniref:DNA topoisomerase 1 n=1 Tax=Candidatus Taylorbacteria bacterium RIFCSPLOWO2_01_FULL_45_15b TaxID=1802319 RepID=A0A1G2NFK4_9BACT|nr:MAG: DNA topoisomerase I [Candidatus Taylorbacteria bacterium RIFCSPLOWO2_01_FULL_45_15b]
MKLFIVESPAKAKTISKYLGDDYTVKASVGHIRDLPKSNKKAIDIAAGFVPHYEISKGKEKVVSEIESLAEGASEIILATDPDREGEAIAWHLAELLVKAGITVKPKRVVYHEITKDAVTAALGEARDIDENLRRAQEARRVLDRLVGYDLSGLIWKKVRYGLSAGRVQSPALRIIVEREREIKAFKPEEFFVITAATETKNKIPLNFICSEEPRDAKEAERILEEGKKKSWSIKSVTETEAKRVPKAPFTTSTLQQAASSRLGFAPSRTMQVAQRLYEAGHITYMRTDSTTLGKAAVAQIASTVEKKFGKNYAEFRTYATKSKNAQEAHEAVRPTTISKESAGANDEQKKLYRLIWQRTVASQMADAKILRTRILANVEGDAVPDFAANGSRILFDGWLRADPESHGEDVELPKVSEGQALTLLDITAEKKETLPPPRYTEAGLVKELEKRGIGRPSTYASIIKTIIDRGYVLKEQRSLRPTDTGEVVSTFLEENFANYISDTFTAEMEDELDDIAAGKREYVKTLKDFYNPFKKQVKEKSSIDKITNMGEADHSMKCPKCGGPMIVKLGKTGKFLSCAKFPDCMGARMMDGKELDGPRDTGELCPKCGKGNLVEREGRFGKFISCATYPKCKFIKKDENALPTTDVVCPTCKTGKMTERRGRFGIFYSCSNYPDCKNAIKAKPTGNICPMCQSLMMDGTKTIPERCSNKACPMHNPHKPAK